MGKALRLSHNNLGAGRVFNKLCDIDFIKHEHDPDIIGISESLLDDFCVQQLKARDFKVEIKSDNERISVLVKKTISYKRRKDLETPGWPVIWIQVGTGKNKLLIANLYREWQLRGGRKSQPNPTNKVSDQLARFQAFVEDWKRVIETEDCEIHVLGDMNLDTLHWRQRGCKPKEWQPLVDLLFKEIISRNFVQTVEVPTRSQGGVDSILDHHYTNNTAFVKSTIVEAITNSDHCYVQVNRTGRKQYTEDPHVMRRNWSKIDWDKACDSLRDLDMSRMYHTRDVNEVVENVTQAIQWVLDQQAPMKMQPNRKNYCPYFDDELKKLTDEKKQSYKRYRKDKSEENWMKYKELRNKVSYQLRKKKAGYVKETLKGEKSSEKLWNFSKNLLGWNSKCGVNEIEVDGVLTKDKEKIASSFNTFFTQKVKNIDSKIPQSDVDPLDNTRAYLKKFEQHGHKIPEFNLRRIHCKDIKKIIGGLNNTKSTSYDNISMFAVKKLRHVITPWLKRILILSFETGVWPEMWKLAKIAPVHKGGEEHSMKNYRPVALLPVLSKVVERAMVDQLTAHLEKELPISADGWTRTSLLSHRQHGYRKQMSTQTNILQLLEDTLKDAEEGVDTGLLMTDCSAAFDTVPHGILLKKLRLYGVSEQALKWFKSYLQGRCQYVEVGSKMSHIERVLLGCFQGSIGAPLLYILYMNDIVMLQDSYTKISLDKMPRYKCSMLSCL